MQMTLEQLEGLTEAQRAKTVLVVQDPFTSFYEARLVSDFIRLIEKLGYQPVLLPFSPNGKAQHVKGFLQRFARTASKTADFLNRVARLGMPMVGIDPATVLCYRDEYRQTLGRRGAISMCCWCMNGCRMRCRNVTSRLPAAKPGICLRTAPKSPPCLQHPVSGRRFFTFWCKAGKHQRGLLWHGGHLRTREQKSGQFAGHICALMASAVAKAAASTLSWQPVFPAGARLNVLKAMACAIRFRLCLSWCKKGRRRQPQAGLEYPACMFDKVTLEHRRLFPFTCNGQLVA